MGRGEAKSDLVVLRCPLLTQSGHRIESPKKSATSAIKNFRINCVDGRARIGLMKKTMLQDTFFSHLTTSLASHLVDAPGQGKE